MSIPRSGPLRRLLCGPVRSTGCWGFRSITLVSRNRRGTKDLESIQSPGRQQSLSDRFRKAVLSLAPEGTFEDQRTELPEHVKAQIAGIPTANRRLAYLVENEVVDPESLLAYYGPLAGTVGENAATLLCMICYKDGRYDEACRLLLENVPGNALASAFKKKVMPNLVEFEREELVMGTLVTELVNMGHCAVAKQFLLEMDYSEDETSKLLHNAKFELQARRLYTREEINGLVEQFFGLGDAFDLFRRKFAASQSLYVQAVLADHLLTITTDAAAKNDLMCQIFDNERVIGEKHFLRYITRSALVRYRKLDELDTAQSVRYIAAFTDSLLTVLRSRKHIMFASDDTEYLALLAYDGKSLTKIWKRYSKLRIDETNDTKLALTRFLNQAVQFKETITCTHIIKHGRGDFDPRILGKAIVCATLGKKRNPKIQDSDVYLGGDDVDTTLIQRIVKYTPPQVLYPALHYAVKALQRVEPSPRILWNLILGLEQSPHLDKIPFPVFRALIPMVLSRPLLEQIRLISLSKVTYNQVAFYLRVYISGNKERMVTASRSKRLDVDAKVILAGMTIMKEKQQQSTDQSNELVRSTRQMTMVVRDLFNGWDSTMAVRMIAELTSQKLTFPDELVVQSVGSLLQCRQTELAFELMERMSYVPKEAYYKFMVHASYTDPYLAETLRVLLVQKKRLYPAEHVLQRMCVGYANSPQLSAHSSIRMVMKMARILHERDFSLGKTAARSLVNSVLARAESNNWGSRKRLEMVLRMARREKIDDNTWAQWLSRVHEMKRQRRGFFSSKYYRRHKHL
ncbi:hypothetical protein TRVA0_026S01134 [Trichomonascus vanleenenianus]|uniref:uncharacterized protein n=1 Tax=Trichomonascus vanleenenianus TaxID=2268995 RepID=UPI003ECB44C2